MGQVGGQITRPYNEELSRARSVRDNGAADCHPLLAWRFAPHDDNHQRRAFLRVR
jgi:hypothetical protein